GGISSDTLLGVGGNYRIDFERPSVTRYRAECAEPQRVPVLLNDPGTIYDGGERPHPRCGRDVDLPRALQRANFDAAITHLPEEALMFRSPVLPVAAATLAAAQLAGCANPLLTAYGSSSVPCSSTAATASSPAPNAAGTSGPFVTHEGET